MRLTGALVIFLSIPLFSNCHTVVSHHFKFTGEHCTINGEASFEKTITEGHKNNQFLVIPDENYVIDYDATVVPDDMSFKDAVITIPTMDKDYTIDVKTTVIPSYRFEFTGEHCTINGEASFEKTIIEGHKNNQFLVTPDDGYSIDYDATVVPDGMSFENEIITIPEMDNNYTINVKTICETHHFKCTGEHCAIKDQFGHLVHELEEDIPINTVKTYTIVPDIGYSLPPSGKIEEGVTLSEDGILTISEELDQDCAINLVSPAKDALIDMSVEVEKGDIVTFDFGEGDDVAIDWGDGHTDKTTSHKYTEDGDYTIAIYNDFTKFKATNNQFITTVNFADELTEINNGAFSGCTKLATITLPSKLSRIGDEAFKDCSSLEAIALPDTVTHIGQLAFFGCSTIQTINIPKNVESIGGGAFAGCSSLQSITIDKDNTQFTYVNNTLIDQKNKALIYAYNDLTTFDMTNLSSIQPYAFYNCSKLGSVTLHDGLEEIGEFAFYGCYIYPTITIPATVSMVGEGAFANCHILNKIYVNKDNKTYHGDSNDTMIIDKDGVLVCGSNYRPLCIPDEITRISKHAFAGVRVSKAKIPTSVKDIGDSAFYGSYLEIVDLTEFHCDSDEVPNLGANAFDDCQPCLQFYCNTPSDIDAFIDNPGWKPYQYHFTYGPVPSDIDIGKRSNGL
ncbi:MAG: leucine-rich repeat domain-containing protein [Bacilli bacterium]|nr:leucine-rich repeat domain-containing protein [Bacilli bacterium]